MDYAVIFNKIKEVVETRKGMNDENIVPELTGIFCHIAFANNLTDQQVVDYLELVKTHKITKTQCEKRFYGVEELISEEIYNNPLFFLTENKLITYIPGKSQTGPGEFFFCFYDSGSQFSVSSTAGYDVEVDGVKMEFKSIKSNFTSEDLFNKYAEQGVVEQLVFVKPVTRAKKPQSRSKFIFADVKKWNEYVEHEEKGEKQSGFRVIF